jgi:hypothetical protein
MPLYLALVASSVEIPSTGNCKCCKLLHRAMVAMAGDPRFLPRLMPGCLKRRRLG